MEWKKKCPSVLDLSFPSKRGSDSTTILHSLATRARVEEAIMARYDSTVQLFAIEEVEGVSREGGAKTSERERKMD